MSMGWGERSSAHTIQLSIRIELGVSASLVRIAELFRDAVRINAAGASLVQYNSVSGVTEPHPRSWARASGPELSSESLAVRKDGSVV
jgi:hypothetical protein